MKKSIGILSLILFLTIVFAGYNFFNYRSVTQNNILTSDEKTNETNSDEKLQENDLEVKEPEKPRIHKLGDTGDDIKELQEKLRRFGYKVSEDGVFEYSTSWAIKIFQKRNSLPVDGTAGEETLYKLSLEPTEETMYKPQEVEVSEKPQDRSSEKIINTMNLTSPTNYLMWVNTKNQHTYVFSGENNNWSLIKDMPCTVGNDSTPTKKGTFYVDEKGLYFKVKGNVRCKYFTQFSGNYLFHSVPLDNNDNVLDSRLGVKVSQGCVRLSIENAKWVQDNMEFATTVFVN
ncbi:L,D-transpeptidase family protein [Clostridium frigidicarnis]|uniref:L,D-transpeptidase catalytic domain n=1 Tax=Clostridium frigidicarnis TaxID=84698 RepID=A0A1I0W8X9_9CLOT|nr:L,D-transpeptidase family protein [Clostridium frigidicarnis]SFA85152.1 L,D-transpeptidase catalytic domain [Clostridium frigidicarnis]